MHVYGDSASIHDAHASALGTELGDLIGQRIEELAGYEGPDLSALIKILVLEPGDALTDVDAELGFPLLARPCDVAQSQRDWFELTLVLSDDGFGVVVYVPKRPDLDPRLLAYCASQVKAPSP